MITPFNLGSAGSGGGAVIETVSMSNRSGLTDTFAASAAAVAAAAVVAHPHVPHYYASASMGMISPPPSETLGLSAGANILNSGITTGSSNGISGKISRIQKENK